MHRFLALFALALAELSCQAAADAHDHTLQSAERSRRIALAQAAAQAEAAPSAQGEDSTAQLTLRLVDKTTGAPVAGLVRVNDQRTGKAVSLAGQIHRATNWHSLPAEATITVPKSKLRVSAFHGIETGLAIEEVDCTEVDHEDLQLALPRIYDPRQSGLRGGNTHLHLNNLSYDQAVHYLKLVPRSDGLDIVFLSHLRRIPDERTYISNVIVESSLAGQDFQRLAPPGVRLGNGQEHRHNFGRGGEGYGHVMFLNIKKLIRPVSIGPGIMRSGTDGIPIQRGIREARGDGATVIWCHNFWGLEDAPNWIEGLLHAQNIFDGGEHGSYEGSFYRYLNLGLQVPFSTGTDWFVYDFSRVYVPVSQDASVRQWLEALAAGRSYITNGTFLELNVAGHPTGDTISMDEPGKLQVRGRAVGRNDFQRLELVVSGEVVHTVASREADGHYECDLDFTIWMDEPGWVALRIPRGGGKNELDRELFAHTSAVYVELRGQRLFRPAVARELIGEMEKNLLMIRSQATFADEPERESVLEVHRRGITELKKRLADFSD